MKFLAVLMLVAWFRNRVSGNPLREQYPTDTWEAWVFSRISHPDLRFAVSVLLPTIVLLFVSTELRGWLLGLPWLILSILVVVYSVEFVDTDLAFDDQGLWLKSLDDEDDLAQLHQSQRNFRWDITYDVFQSMIPALFWFLVLGPAGALLYGLCRNYADDDGEPELQTGLPQILQFWMEWIPARVHVLVFAVLGDFARTWRLLLESILDVEEPVVEMLGQSAEAAVGTEEPAASTLDDFVTATEFELDELRLLLDRSLWGWVGVAALMTILGF